MSLASTSRHFAAARAIRSLRTEADIGPDFVGARPSSRPISARLPRRPPANRRHPPPRQPLGCKSCSQKAHSPTSSTSIFARPRRHHRPEHHDRRALSVARPLGRLHRAGRGRPRRRLRAVRARSRALRHARGHAGDGALAAAHRAAGDPRGLARGQAAHRRRHASTKCPGTRRSTRSPPSSRACARPSATPRSSAAPTAGRRPDACIMPAAWCGVSCSSAAAASTRSATTASARRSTCCRA